MSSRPLFLGVSVAAGLVLVTGCGAAPDDPSTEAVGTSDEAIKGGYVDAKDKSVVGIYDVSQGALCSGSLIAPNVVLTARHCVAPVLNEVQGGISCSITNFGANGAASHFLVSTDAVLSASSSSHGVQEVITPPADSKVCGNDQAILILSDSVPPTEAVPLTPRVDTPISAKDEYVAIGYGGTQDNGSGAGQRRRRDHLFVACVAGKCPSFQVTKTEWTGDQGICQGDSGGPAIDLQGRVIGVTSRGAAGCVSPVYGYVFGWAQWIKDTAVHGATVGNYAPPPWATGFPTDPAYGFTPGDACQKPEDCASGRCIDDGVASYCTRVCDDQGPCPTGYTCNADMAVCFQDHPAPAVTPKATPSVTRAAKASGCAVPPLDGDDPTKPVPWRLTGVALAVAALLRRSSSPRKRFEAARG